mgnify:CR=1 FL=1
MKIFLTMLILALVTCVLHIMWERSHISLYTAYEKMEGVLPVYVFATLGDIGYTLGAIALIGLIKGDMMWLASARPSDFLMLALLGFGIALFVEYKALALDRWAYTSEMPILPYFQVGFTPILQMTVLLPLSVYITRIIGKSFI